MRDGFPAGVRTTMRFDWRGRLVAYTLCACWAVVCSSLRAEEGALPPAMPEQLEQPADNHSSLTSGSLTADAPPSPAPAAAPEWETVLTQVQRWMPAERWSASLQLIVSMTVVGLIPAALLMTTAYVRISVVLALLRQAFGVPNLLPMQATTALALFCTGWIMWPTWQVVHEQAIVPLLQGQTTAAPAEIWRQGITPIRQFMVAQIEANHNSDDVHLFLSRAKSTMANYPQSYDEVPLAALLPAFLLSELKTAFIIGFQIYLPFLVIDLVVSAMTTSMGLMLMSPTLISMPMKLLVFVLVDGWHLLVDMLMRSFA